MLAFVGGSYAVHSAGTLAAPAGTAPGDVLLALLNEDSSNGGPSGWTKAGKDTSGPARHVAMMKIATGSDSIAFGTTPENGSMAAYRGLALPAVKTGDWSEIPSSNFGAGAAMDLPAIVAAGAVVIAGFALANGLGATISPGSGYTADYSVNVFGDDWAFLWQHSTAGLPGTVVPDASWAGGTGTNDMWGQAFVVSPHGVGLSMMM